MYIFRRKGVFVSKYLKLLSFVLVFLFVFSSAIVDSDKKISAAVITTAYIDGEGVNVRKGPSTSKAIIDTVSYTSATVISTSTKGEEIWYEISYNNGEEDINGYIYYDPEYIRIVSFDPDAEVSEQIRAFPESYQDALSELSKAYPNWSFVPDPVKTPFNECVAKQTVKNYKQVSFKTDPVSWRSMGSGYYDWDTGEWTNTNGGWAGASREIIAYYMDPRNFLNASNIFMFLKHNSFSEKVTENHINKIIKNSFMADGYETDEDDPYNGSYEKLIIAAGEISGFDPCVIAAKILLEQGSKGSSLTSGKYTSSKYPKTYKGYYNFFNINATGKTNEDVIVNGLKYAKEKGWDTVYKAILEGAEFLKDSYIERGQNTYFYQDFQVHNSGTILRQYAQNVADAYSKGSILSSAYIGDAKAKLTFIIPVFSDLPKSSCELPEKSSKLNNYYFSDISVDGLTPSFKRYTYEYGLEVEEDTKINYTLPKGATLVTDSKITVKKGLNKVVLTVKSETGYTTDYTISVNADSKCKLTLVAVKSDDKKPTSSSDSDDSKEDKIKKGDANGDGKISISDVGNIRLHLLGKLTIKDNLFKGADVNGDGKISISDIGNIRLHLLGKITIEGWKK